MTDLRHPLVAALLLLAVPAAAETCPVRGDSAQRARRPATCPPPAKVEPYDPDRARAGRRPGFIDLGGGTEVRIGGRARVDYDVRR
ncbi:hypothetical protein [uncultured Enterovirga sp.]|uniref:hypothetical protein n=1 Tax=uncultured Enterovirga sp. TaxID=2026352 RepID=UPI0035CA6349